MYRSTIVITAGIVVSAFLQVNIFFAQPSPEKPNVIVIFTDDLGTLDMNSYGSEDLITPHMDDLAASGVKFTQFNAGAPICSPSRAGLPGNVPIPENKEGAGLATEQLLLLKC